MSRMRLLILLILLSLAPWIWPVAPHEVVRAFDPPATPYGAGHRGIDIAAPSGTPVLAPQDGVVRFAGQVAGRPVVSIEHAGGLISSFEPVAPTVAAGEPVLQGQQMGVLQPGHAPGATRLHLGARLHGAYIDPLGLLGVERPVLLPSRVHKSERPRQPAHRPPAATAHHGQPTVQARGCAVRYASDSRSSDTWV